VNSCLYFDGTGHINQIVGGYDDVDNYLALKASQRQAQLITAHEKATSKTGSVNKKVDQANKNPTKTKLSYKETRELEELPKIIDDLENNIAKLQEQVNQADFFSQDAELTKKILNQLAEYESKLDLAYTRWQELDEQ